MIYNLAYLLEEMGDVKRAEAEYTRAIAIQEKVVKEYSAAHEDARRLSSSLINLGELAADRGAADRAEKLIRRGLEIQETLAREYPSIPEYRKYLGRTLRTLAGRLAEWKKLPQARAAFRRSIEVQELLVKQYPKFPEYPRDLASTYNNFANLELVNGNTAKAETGFRKALAIQEPLVRRYPKIPEFRQEIGNSYGNLGTALLRRQTYAEAERAFRRALGQDKVLLARFPDAAEYLLRKGMGEGNVGLSLSKQGKGEKALAWYGRALQDMETARRQMKRLPAQGLEWLRNTYSNRAAALEERGRFRDALADWQQLVRLASPEQRGPDQLRMALCLAQSGQAEKAIATAGKLTTSKETSGEMLLAAARVYARAAKISPSPRKEDYAAQSLQLLRRAERRGQFHSGEQIARLREDPHLSSLQSFSDFQRWLANVRPRMK